MGVHAKVRVNFAEGCLVDFDQLVHDLKSTYNIGFAGLYKVEGGVSLFIQRHNDVSTRMTLSKVQKICTNVADVTEVLPFETCEGTLLDSFGNFRSRGRKANVTVNSHNTNNSHNTTTNSHNTNSHNTTNIHLHINALGKEDISHITKEHLDDIIGTREEVLEYLESNMPFHAQSELMKKHWEMFRRYAQKKVRRWDKQQEHQDPGHQSLRKSLNIQSDSEEDEEDEQPVMERPPIYDPDSDSEGNLKRKRVCFEEGMIETYPGHTFQDFLTAFETLLLENPHNNNIVASTKDKYFKYFNGDDWVKLNKNQFFEEVTTRRVEKADDTLNKMVRDGSMSEFTRDQVSSMIKKLLDFTSGTEMELKLRDTREEVANGILTAEKNGARLARIGKLLGRRIVRVGDSTKGNVVRSSTWESLEMMSR